MDVVVAADPVRNIVRVSGEPAACRRVGELVAAIDRQPAQVVCEMLIVQAPAGFTDSIGLDLSSHAASVLSPREAKLLTAIVSKAIRASGEVNILSRPSLMVADNQTGMFEIRSERAGLVARVTPRQTPEGKLLLRAETRLTTRVTGNGADGQTSTESQVTGLLENGGGLVVRGLVAAADDGRPCELLWVIAVRRVEPQVSSR